jgi:hypothetical protein
MDEIPTHLIMRVALNDAGMSLGVISACGQTMEDGGRHCGKNKGTSEPLKIIFKVDSLTISKKKKKKKKYQLWLW